MQTRLQAIASSRSFGRMALLPIVVATALVAGCGDKSAPSEKATQAAARVNGSEITVHQINQVLERQPGLKPEQAEAASHRVLESLIDQQVAVDKAEEQKLDRDPQVVQMLDAARRGILARVYLERAAAAGAGTPTDEDIRKYYDAKPALFSQRRIYALQEFTVPSTPEQYGPVIEQLKASKSAAEYAEILKNSGLKVTVNQVTQPAEGLPLALVDKLAQVNDGEALYVTAQDGFKAILVAATRSQPLSFDQAKGAIEQFLTVERRRNFVQQEVKNLREAAKVEYLGKFAEKPADAASAPTSVTDTSLAAPAASDAAPAPAAEPAPEASPASSELDADALSKGLSGLK